MQAITNSQAAVSKQPEFSLPVDVSRFAGQYEVYCPHDGEERSSFDVCGPSGLDIDFGTLRDMLIADMPRPGPKVDWAPTGDEFDDSEPDYAPKLALNYLTGTLDASADRLSGTYLVFAKDATGQVVGYTAASICLSFYLPNGTFDSVSFDDAWTWVTTSKRRNLKAYLRVSLQETYTLADHRGAGACTATMDYIAGIVHKAVEDLVDVMAAPLLAHRKTLEFDLELYAEWESKSGCLASGTLMTELTCALMGVREDIRRKGIPVKLPKAWGYDAGF